MASSNGRAPRLFLIRHGDTVWSDSGQHTGRSDIPLTSRGEARALALKERLDDETFVQVFTSPLIRAFRTCELAGFADRAEINQDLVEWDYGDYEGLTSAQIDTKQPGWDLFRDGAPNGESPDDVAERADRFLQLVQSIDADVAAFSSGHFIRMIAVRWLGLEPLLAKHFYTATASIGILGYEHGRSTKVIRLWNDTRP